MHANTRCETVGALNKLYKDLSNFERPKTARMRQSTLVDLRNP